MIRTMLLTTLVLGTACFEAPTESSSDAGTSSGGGTGAAGGGSSAAGGGTVSAGGGTTSAGGGTASAGGGTTSAGGGTTSAGGGTASAGGGGTDAGTLANFSFFVTSLRALQALSGSASGFGGDLRYGETGQGAGLRGADKLCAAIAERSMPGSSVKGWRAFLSVTADSSGAQVNAIDRVGAGPWYDRLGRLVAAKKADLLTDRPTGASSVIINDLPNEDGVPNHDPELTGQVDNHDTLTGSNAKGQLYGSKATCLDWTSKLGKPTVEGTPRVGHSWPRAGGGGSGMGTDNPANWISALDEAGCAAGVNLIETGAPNPNDPTVGSGGGYGGFYCFALTP